MDHKDWSMDQFTTVLFTNEFRLSLISDSRLTFIQRELGTNYLLSIVQEIDHQGNGCLMEISFIAVPFQGRMLEYPSKNQNVCSPINSPFTEDVFKLLMWMGSFEQRDPHLSKVELHKQNSSDVPAKSNRGSINREIGVAKGLVHYIQSIAPLTWDSGKWLKNSVIRNSSIRKLRMIHS
ncbi:hypothetical protein TNCV_4500671 [Trichonephila clavipes]|nr:hypothetical protein TNCV_4500671 [Trichonephila clavipes]